MIEPVFAAEPDDLSLARSFLDKEQARLRAIFDWTPSHVARMEKLDAIRRLLGLPE
jgi:hypothetical protein